MPLRGEAPSLRVGQRETLLPKLLAKHPTGIYKSVIDAPEIGLTRLRIRALKEAEGLLPANSTVKDRYTLSDPDIAGLDEFATLVPKKTARP